MSKTVKTMNQIWPLGPLGSACLCHSFGPSSIRLHVPPAVFQKHFNSGVFCPPDYTGLHRLSWFVPLSLLFVPLPWISRLHTEIVYFVCFCRRESAQGVLFWKLSVCFLPAWPALCNLMQHPSQLVLTRIWSGTEQSTTFRMHWGARITSIVQNGSHQLRRTWYSYNATKNTYLIPLWYHS